MAAFAILLRARATFSALKAGTVALIQGFSVQEHPPGGEHPVALTVIKHRVHWVCAYTLLRPTKGQKCLTANRDFNTFLLDLSFKKTEKQPKKKKTKHKTKHHQQTKTFICHFVSEVGRRSLFTFFGLFYNSGRKHWFTQGSVIPRIYTDMTKTTALVKTQKSCSPAFTCVKHLHSTSEFDSNPLSSIHAATNRWSEAPWQVISTVTSFVLFKVWIRILKTHFSFVFRHGLCISLFLTLQSELTFNPLPSSSSVLRVHWGHVLYIFFVITKLTEKSGGIYFKIFHNSRAGAVRKDYALRHWWSNHELARLGFCSTKPQIHLKQWLAFLLLFQIGPASFLT